MTQTSTSIRLTPDYSTSPVLWGALTTERGTLVAGEGSIRAWVAAVRADDSNSAYGHVVPALDVYSADGALCPWALCVTTDGDPIVLPMAGRDRDGCALYSVDPIGTWEALA